MPITFCAKWDSTLNATVDPCGADNLVPDFAVGRESIDTLNAKFGAGCLTDGPASDDINLGWIEGTDFSRYPGNSGAMGVWLKTLSADNMAISLFMYGSGSNSAIFVDCILNTNVATGLDMRLQMWDSGATKRIDATLQEGYVNDANWHYVELDWLWNDAGGISEVSFDGIVKISDNGGDSFSKDNTDMTTIEIFGESDEFGEDLLLDDLFVSNTVLNVGNFSVPTSPYCVCGAVEGWNRFGGEMSNWNRFSG